MNMVEKVARALCVACGNDPDRLEPGNCVGDWEGCDAVMPNGDPSHFMWRSWVSEAKAAIEAMRDPTDVMIGCGILAYDGKCEQSYRAMIDAALKEVK